MNRIEFLRELSERIGSMPQKEQEEVLSFYSEMISERMEDGMTEEQAVEALGSVDEIAQSAMMDMPLATIIKEKVRPKHKLRVWEILLIVIGSPLWLSLALAALAVLLAVYIVLWTLVLVLWVVVIALGVCAVAGLPASVMAFVHSSAPMGLALLGASMILAALCIFFSVLSAMASKGASRLSVLIIKAIKKCFI